MRRATRISACALAAAAVAVTGAVAATAPSGTFMGLTEQKKSFAMNVSGKRIQYVTFSFKCSRKPSVVGTVSLQDFPIRKRDGVYRFSIFAYASMNYSDDRGYENGKVNLKGRFSASGRSATGTVRTRTKRCGNTGALKWHARR